MPQIVAPPESHSHNEPIITTCPHCQYTISYTEDEVDRVDNESIGIYCPHCGGVIVIKHIEPFTFPITFSHIENSVSLTDEEIQNYVNIIKRQLQQEVEVGEFAFISAGDTIVFGLKFEDEDNIIVAKNYWEDSVLH